MAKETNKQVNHNGVWERFGHNLAQVRDGLLNQPCGGPGGKTGGKDEGRERHKEAKCKPEPERLKKSCSAVWQNRDSP